MAGQIASAQAEIEHHIAEMRTAAATGGDTGSLALAENQQSALGRLQHRIAHAHGAGLAGLRAEVVAYVAVAQSLGQQARGVASSAHVTGAALHEASVAARREVDGFLHDFYERKIFDLDLRFASEADKRAYRERETERRREIEEARATETPQGDLRALNLSIQQMEDAGAHGAKANPIFQTTLDGLTSTRDRLEEELVGERKDAAQEARTNATAETLQAKPDLPPELLVALRASGTVIAEQGQQGHGVNHRESSAESILGRG